jgi:predicted Rossmann-fold nucleotide-binding protein
MKILVCGGRDYKDRAKVYEVLDEMLSAFHLTAIIHGGATGADRYAGDWAMLNGVTEVIAYANWNAHGKSAGPIRNKAMLALFPNRVIAFPGGAGTANMAALAKKAFIPVEEIE